MNTLLPFGSHSVAYRLFSCASTGRGCGFVELQRLGDNHPIIPFGSSHRVIPIAHIFEHLVRVTLERIAIPTASGTHCDKAVTSLDATVGHLGRQRCFLAICCLQNELAGRAGASPVVPPGTVGQAIAFDRGASVTQVANRLNRGEATSPLAWSAGVLPQFVALHPQWDMGLDILNRIITSI